MDGSNGISHAFQKKEPREKAIFRQENLGRGGAQTTPPASAIRQAQRVRAETSSCPGKRGPSGEKQRRQINKQGTSGHLFSYPGGDNFSDGFPDSPTPPESPEMRYPNKVRGRAAQTFHDLSGRAGKRRGNPDPPGRQPLNGVNADVALSVLSDVLLPSGTFAHQRLPENYRARGWRIQQFSVCGRTWALPQRQRLVRAGSSQLAGVARRRDPANAPLHAQHVQQPAQCVLRAPGGPLFVALMVELPPGRSARRVSSGFLATFQPVLRHQSERHDRLLRPHASRIIQHETYRTPRRGPAGTAARQAAPVDHGGPHPCDGGLLLSRTSR